MFLFFSYKGQFDTFVFHKEVNSIRADTSSPLVPTRCLLFLVTNGNLPLLFFIWEQIIPTRCVLFLVTNGNLTLLFFIREQIVCTTCLLLLVVNGNLTLLFFIWE